METIDPDNKTNTILKYVKQKWLIITSGCLGIVIVFVVVIFIVKNNSTTQESDAPVQDTVTTESEAIQKGKNLSHNNCSGEGPVTLGTSPMKEEDFVFLIPYGLMIGSHVTPIDHQYFSPTDFYSPRDTYEVMAMADGKIVDIQHRLMPPSEYDLNGTDEYRIVFMHTCTFFTYYDLVTSLAPDILEEFNRSKNNNYATLDFEVQEGEVIGWIGGQTLDFAVWDTEITLEGFVVPEHYESEAWKIHTADPYNYYSDELKELLTEKNLRTTEPIAGKIDYDIDGKLIGNWFEEGTGGYAGNGENYWDTHLSIVPEHIDPTATMISIGDFDGEAKQFIISRDSQDPSTVSTDSGLVMYDLYDLEYLKSDGSSWDRFTLVKNVRTEPTQQNNGCILFQLIEDRRLKVETFPDIVCSESFQFTSNSIIFER
jgi:quinol monooxygenase YgiN